MSKYIHVKGARVHNLKNIEVKIPRNKFIVVTGVSGSGKSSLAFNTLYAEGQRRYVESLSSYARQFLGRIDKPEVDFVKGIPPAIAIEQKVNTKNPRSTVGTSTELYDYIKLLYAKAGKTYSPVSGEEVFQHTVTHVVDYLKTLKKGSTIIILAPISVPKDRTLSQQLKLLLQQGFSRVESNGIISKIDQFEPNKKDTPALVIDRIQITDDLDEARIADSVQTAFYEGQGNCILLDPEQETRNSFSNQFEADGIVFEKPSVEMFSFNNPLGACPVCEGYGKVIGIDPDLVIPNKNLSIYEEAIICWKGEKMQKWLNNLLLSAPKFDFPIHRPYLELTAEERKLLWTGNKYFKGLNDFFKYIESKQYKIQYRVMLSRYRGRTVCGACEGTRLKKEASYVKIDGKSITELVNESIENLHTIFKQISLTSHQMKIVQRILLEIKNRIEFLNNVGLGYLTLNRLSSTLSGGESQRINLATSLGSSLTGSLYVLDEPSIGLHSRDTNLLIKVLKNLRDLGNTVLVVEHDEEIIKEADEIIDIGPQAGRLGGEVVFAGNHPKLKSAHTLTSDYLNGTKEIEVPKIRRKWNSYIEVLGARENNLKNINVKFPLHTLTGVAGVSGSGKSTLVKSILTPALRRKLDIAAEKTGEYDGLRGDTEQLTAIEYVDQNPIGKSSRSNPVTYIKAYDEIRTLFASQQRAKQLGMKPAHFSFNVDGGRCDECQGEGETRVEMQFMADVRLLCESCQGKRFKEDVLQVLYRDKNIYEILEMTVEEALAFFSQESDTTTQKIVKKLQVLADVGLDYVKLGQASSTLSGGESQRIKLAFYLSKEKVSPTLFVFDEPTTGLHFHDIHKLLKAFNALVDRGHTIIVIEHNMDVLKCTDWIIELGTEGGANGGNLIFEGTPEELLKHKTSYTSAYLKEKL